MIATIQVSFRPKGEIFRVMQISPRSTRRNDNHLDSYKMRLMIGVGETAVSVRILNGHCPLPTLCYAMGVAKTIYPRTIVSTL